MPILSSIAGAAAKAYGLMSNALRLITDNFNRANGSLGTTNTGQSWNAIRGTWSISSNKATSSDAASTYPMATVDINSQNVIVSADITDGGPGLAFWITDANSWWASAANYRSVYTSSGYYANSYSATYYTGSLVQTGTNSYCSGDGCSACSFLTIYNGVCTDGETGNPCPNCTLVSEPIYSCTGPGGNAYSGGGNCGTQVSGGLCNQSPGGAGGACNFVDTSYNTYYTELKLYKNISGTISTVATQQLNSNTSAYSKVNSIKVVTSGDSITVSGYSNVGLTSQLGSDLTNTPSSPAKGTKVGIIKTPSSENSGSLLDNFSAQNN